VELVVALSPVEVVVAVGAANTPEEVVVVD
jgi:hypothetical protein